MEAVENLSGARAFVWRGTMTEPKTKKTPRMKQDYLLNPAADPRTELPIAAFDMDWTLICPRDGRRFPLDLEDWQWLRPSVPVRVREIAKDHRIVIVTDQSKPWRLRQIMAVIDALDVPVTAIVGGVTKKPSTTWVRQALGPTDAERIAFYVGDAAGRPGDWSDADRLLAEGLGVPFHVADEFWPAEARVVPPGAGREVIVMIGFPGSGKTTVARGLEERGYYRVDGDALATATAMIRDATRHPDKSIVFDSTAGTIARRSQFVDWASSVGLPVRFVWIQTGMEEAMRWNAAREKPVPAVAFYTYRKRFESPTEAEGAALVCLA
jgi:bifunctional polynucleotide phosphatase/kinase